MAFQDRAAEEGLAVGHQGRGVGGHDHQPQGAGP